MTLDCTIAENTECNPLYEPRLTEIIQTLESEGTVEKEIYIEEEQFSNVSYIGTIRVRNHTHAVTHLTDEIIEGRRY